MKLFYTRKDFRDLVEEHKKEIKKINDDHKKEVDDLNETIKNKKYEYFEKYNKYFDKCTKLEETNKYHQRLIELRDSDIARLSKKLRQANGARGGFVARINELIKQVDEITEKFDKYKAEKEIEIVDLKSDRYLKIECEPDKTRKTQKMQIYSKGRTSNIIKNVKEKL